MATEFYNRNWRMPKSSNSSKVSNYSMSFDGSDKINCGNDSILNLTSTISLSAWVKPTTAITSQDFPMFIAKGLNSDYMLFANSGTGTARMRLGSSFLIDSTSTIPTNVWTHIVGTYDGVTLKIYVNGVSENPTSQTGAIPSTSGNLQMGSANNGNKFTGKIDHVAIFDYALSSSQVTALYGNSTDGVGNPMAITGGRKPIAYYPIGDYAAFNGSEYLVNNGALQDYVFDFGAANAGSEYINAPTDIGGFTKCSTSAWINPSSVSAKSTIFATNTANNFNAYFWTGDIIFVTVDGAYGYLSSISNYINADKWNHLSIVYDGTFTDSDSATQNAGRLKMYVNGSYIAFTAYFSTIPSSIPVSGSDNIRIGTTSPTTYEFGGKMSNFSIFNTALPATGTESVESLYNYGTPPNIASYSNLQGWWKLDASATFDGSNWSIPDDSSNSNTGTSSGMTAANLVQSTLNITTPYSRYALNFDSASSDKITGTGALISGNDSRSFSLWYKTTSTTPQIPFSLGSPTDQTNGAQFAYCINRSSTTNAAIFGKNSAYDTSVFTVPNTSDGEWHHLLVTYDQSSLKVYLDGNLEATPALPSTSYITSAGFTIGGWTMVGNRLFNGDISNVSVWNAALTSTQVTEIYNEGKPSNLNNHSAYSNLVSWWQLGENSSFDGTNWTVLDEKGTNNGTSANMTEADLVNGVGTSANGLSDGMGGADNIIGDAPYSTANAVSYGMGVDALSTDVPS